MHIHKCLTKYCTYVCTKKQTYFLIIPLKVSTGNIRPNFATVGFINTQVPHTPTQLISMLLVKRLTALTNHIITKCMLSTANNNSTPCYTQGQ